MRASRLGDPSSKGSPLAPRQVVVNKRDAAHVIPKQGLIDVTEVSRLDPSYVLGEQKKQDADCEPHLVAVEERVGARRVDVDAAFLEALREVARVAVLHRFEQEGHLVVVVDCAGLLEGDDEVAESVAPVSLPVLHLDDRRGSLDCLSDGVDGLLEAVPAPVEPESRAGCSLHPVVVKGDDARVGPVVLGKVHPLARAVPERLGELQDVSDGGPAEPVEALVVVADDADVHGVAAESQDELLLDVVRVLVLVHHDVANLPVDGLPDLRVKVDELQGLKLDVREVEPIRLCEELVVQLDGLGIGHREGVSAFEHPVDVQQLLRRGARDAAYSSGNVPRAALLGEVRKVLQLPEPTVVLEHEILLVEGICDPIALPQVRVLDMLLDDAETEGVEGADVHFPHVEGEPP